MKKKENPYKDFDEVIKEVLGIDEDSNLSTGVS